MPKEKEPLTKTDVAYFCVEAGFVLLGISWLPSGQSGIALFALLVEFQRRVSKDLK